MRPPDPFAAFRFVVEINGTLEAGFSEASGFEAETEVEDRNEGGINDYTHKLAKHTKYPNLSLKRGITQDAGLWEWHQRIVSGQVERQNISVILRDAQKREVWRWVFYDAWPVKWSGSGLNATNNQVFVESLDFAHHGMKRVAL
jgi:phage tail-like protein